MSSFGSKCGCEVPAIHRHGGRRRRCVNCGRTWSIRPVRPGRRYAPVAVELACKILVDRERTRRLAKGRHCSLETIRRRCRLACDYLIQSTSLPKLSVTPEVPLVLIADGLWCRFGNEPWVLYNMAVKPVGEPIAFFLEPLILRGRENSRGWSQVLATIPSVLRARIKAVVTDGFCGYERVARNYGWLAQRCHRHLDTMLFGISGCGRRKLRGGETRKRIATAVREARTTTDRQRLDELRQVLCSYTEQPDLTLRIRGVVRRFLHDLIHFRTYLDYPELTLPTTTNAVESRNSQLRDSLRCINNPTAALRRARAHTRLHPTITCNGHENPQD